ncbi:hypothetical protein COU18_02395 [Candidatus Kaiserbacteria bacterium CG10_big_fil_rev_8_21_14_0_10_51_14]|uniref:Uncharacterized protein n=1 Tax=Candidatus Kaiserbacteria bacterium CG10_big_fil_rev_8_21_14_0_10_51_14 TaxID=1974610 RepID=A0A2H0UBN1_9BACT|nr:MAG: hypothetical protein COU18_02395 [Candidatus Kaiserbacteria bacterium CG10_big_fil_rev_8_21_14_0_10_51_14]
MRFVLAGLGSFVLTVTIAHAFTPPLYSEYREPRTLFIEGIAREHDLERNVLVVDTGPSDVSFPYPLVRITYSDTTEWTSVVQKIRGGVFVSEGRSQSSERSALNELVIVVVELSDTLELHAQNISVVTAEHL